MASAFASLTFAASLSVLGASILRVTNFGRNLPTRSWYTLYSGYLPALNSSVNQVLDWNNIRYENAPANVQFVKV